MAVKIYATVIDSKTLFQKPSNDSANSQMRLKSSDPFVKVDGVTFYFLPESIVWAAYDHPEAVDLSSLLLPISALLSPFFRIQPIMSQIAGETVQQDA